MNYLIAYENGDGDCRYDNGTNMGAELREAATQYAILEDAREALKGWEASKLDAWVEDQDGELPCAFVITKARIVRAGGYGQYSILADYVTVDNQKGSVKIHSTDSQLFDAADGEADQSDIVIQEARYIIEREIENVNIQKENLKTKQNFKNYERVHSSRCKRS